MEEQQDIKSFSLAALLLVTGFCFLLFTLLLRIADGVSTRLFLWIGIVTFVAGLLAGGATLRSRTNKKNKSKLAP